MGTVAIAFVSVLGDDGTEVFFVATGVSLGLLALVTGAMVAVLNVFLLFELLKGKFLFVGGELFELFKNTDLGLVFKQGRSAE